MENKNCPCCKNDAQIEAEYCSFCKFPYNGSELDKSKHIGLFISQKGILETSDDSISKSKNILFTISAINILALFINKLDAFGLIISIFSTVMILLCAIFFEKNPKILTIIPLSILLFFYLINFLFDPNTLLQGIIIKIFIIGGLSYNLYTIIEAEKFKQKNNLK